MESKISLIHPPPPPYQSTLSVNTLSQLPAYQSSLSVNHLSGPSDTKGKSTSSNSQWTSKEIWTILLPYMQPSTLSELARTCNSLYNLVIPHLWRSYRIRTDDQLWYLLSRLKEDIPTGGKGWKGKGKGKLSIFKRSTSTPTPSPSSSLRLRNLLYKVETIIFDIIPSPTICALIPLYLSQSKLADGQYILFPNVTHVQFTPHMIQQIAAWGWRPFQYSDYLTHLPEGDKRDIPSKESQLPFAHLVKPDVLCMDLAPLEGDSEDAYLYDKLCADEVFGSSGSFWTSLGEIHTHLPGGFDLKFGEVVPFLKGRKHFVHLPERMFGLMPRPRLDSRRKAEGYDDHEYTRQKSELIRDLTGFLLRTVDEDILLNYPMWEEDMVEYTTRWIVRYPPGAGAEEVMRKVKIGLVERVVRGEIAGMGRDDVVLVGDEADGIGEEKGKGNNQTWAEEKVKAILDWEDEMEDYSDGRVELRFMGFEQDPRSGTGCPVCRDVRE